MLKVKMASRKLNSNRGVALVFTLMFIVVLIVFGSIFVLRSVNEWKAAHRERLIAQSFSVSEGGAEDALNTLDILINTYMLNTVNATNPQIVGNKANNYVGTGDAIGFLVEFVKNGGTAQLTLVGGTQAEYTKAATALGSGTYQFKIIVTEKSNPVIVATDIWDFPYNYEVQGQGTVSGVTRKVHLLGDFTVRVQRDNFAKFALFTDHHSMPSGSTVWFTAKTNFAGPIHTNERYSFALNPSGTFDGVVTQHHNTARFHNGGSPILADADSNGTIDVPTFNAGYTRGVNEIVLSSSVQQQDLADQAKGGQNPAGNGIFVPNNGTTLTGGIFVRGNSTIAMGVDAGDNAQYTITEGSTTTTVTVDIPNNQTTVQTGAGAPVTYSGQPKGLDELGTIIYVDGSINGLHGTVQRDTEVTISSQTDIVIDNNIRYSEYTPAVGTPGTVGYTPPTATGTTNLLGLVAWGGNVRVSTAAPNNIDMHGIVMARNGIFTVDNYNDTGVGSRGTATLLGGAITQFYGAFGQFNSSTGQQTAGYGRNFVYDDRTLVGKSPPYFPSMKTFIAFTNDITDKIGFQEGGF